MGQQLTMTPQLQQAIRLLQLSTLDLQQEIQEALESNPMLERQEDGEDFDNSDPMADNAENKPAAEVQDNSFQETSTSSTAENLEDGEWAERIPNELPVDTAWEDIYQTSASSLPSNDDDEWDFTTRTSVGESLQSHLLWQLNLAPMSDTDRLIAVTLIDSINGQGYLEDSLEEICAGFDPELDIELDEVEAVLHRIQQFEPAGIGARSLGECLLLQLRQLPASTPWMGEAQRLVTDFIDLLGSRDYSQLMRRMKLKEDELRQVIELVQTLNPRPGSQIESSEPEYVVPDVIVRKDSERWLVELNQEAVPRLRVNPQYAGFVRRADTSADKQPAAGSALVHQEPAEPQRDADEGGDTDRRAPARLPRPWRRSHEAAGAARYRRGGGHARVDHFPGDHAEIHAHPARHLRTEILFLQPREHRRRRRMLVHGDSRDHQETGGGGKSEKAIE